MASKFTEAVRQLLESELQCPECGVQNTVGDGGQHIELQADGIAVCRNCLCDWRPKVDTT